MLNCQFFVTAQCNPHIVPFFFNTKGDVGRPSRWSSGTRDDSWRGGFLLSALELYLKTDMIAKLKFLSEVEAAVGFFGTLFTQSTYGGSTTIVPHVVLKDYFKVRREGGKGFHFVSFRFISSTTLRAVRTLIYFSIFFPRPLSSFQTPP